MLSHGSRDISIFSHIAISGCPSLSQLFGDTFFELAMVKNLDIVTSITIILISDPFSSRVSTLTRDIDIANPSVRLSVRQSRSGCVRS